MDFHFSFFLVEHKCFQNYFLSLFFTQTMEVPPDAAMPFTNKPVDLVDVDGNTCLMLSCELGYYEVASFLLKKARCSLEFANNSGFTALHLASISGHLECVQVQS